MNPTIQSVLDEYQERADRERIEIQALSREELEPRLDEFLLPVGPDVGRLLNLLVKASGTRVLVEVGTSHGYSALWLAEAARETGGRLYSFDIHAGKQAYAREALARAGLAEHVQFVLGDVLETIDAVSDPIGFALIDHWKSQYLPCFEMLLPRLAPGAILVADNVDFPEDSEGHVQAYRTAVAATPGMVTLKVPLGSGIELSRYAG